MCKGKDGSMNCAVGESLNEDCDMIGPWEGV